MAIIPIPEHEQGDVSREIINDNFAEVDTSLDGKIQYTGATPAVGDLIVAGSTDGLLIQKKVFSASQTLESDASGQPISAAKGTAYNKNFGTGAADIPEGNVVVRLTGAQTISDVKTFTSSPIVPTPTNNTDAATKAYVDAGPSCVKGSFTRVADDASATVTYTHGLGRIPKTITLFALGRTTAGGNPMTSTGVYANGANSGIHTSGYTAATSSSASMLLYGASAALNSGVVGNVTTTQFDIVWTRSGSNNNDTYNVLFTAI